MIVPYLFAFSGEFLDMQEKNELLKEKAIKEYKEALKMPRKKKKKAKKSALLLYSIACWGEDLINHIL